MTDAEDTVSREVYAEAIRISEQRRVAAQEALTTVGPLIEERDRLREMNGTLSAEKERLSEQLADRNETIRNQNEELANRRSKIDKLVSRVEDREAEIEELRSKIIEVTGQIEELSVSPLDLVQQQRLKALVASRGVVEETSSSNVFSKSGKKVSLAGVVSTAHFIITGERDYVTADGEYVLDPTRRAFGATVPFAEVYRDAGHVYTERDDASVADLDPVGGDDS